uniref:Integrase catalytic domain-containing protein n=1 Tax=Ananas comosus var. bracteatus TaxID=296719 RepID=A0A6V7NHC2_ANACO|nr:unnamed protein product [Ananas comosus var. bracteatus]
MGNNSTRRTVGVGSVHLRMYDGMVWILENVRHVPDLKKGLISLSELDNKGYKFTGQGGVIKVSKGALVVMKGIQVGNLYKLLGSTMTNETYAATENDDLPLRLWHKRLGHMSKKGMKILVEKNLIPNIIFSDSKFCEHCVYEKHHKRSFKAGSHTSKGIPDYIHTDVWSSPTTSYGGANYYISFIDDFSQKVWVKFLKSKGEAFQAFKHFKAEVENLIGRRIKVLRSDNGLEYKSKEFKLFCKENGISRHYTNPYDPQQNGVAERMNRTLMERARSMLSNAGLEHELWARPCPWHVILSTTHLPWL